MNERPKLESGEGGMNDRKWVSEVAIFGGGNVTPSLVA
jgi:hypothetical protein